MLPHTLVGIARKAGLETVERQLIGVPGSHVGCGEHLGEVLVDIAAKVGRVVGVDGGAQAGVQQLAQVVVLQVGKHAQLLVRQRAHRERDAVLRQALHQGGIVHGLHAVVDALDLEHIQGAPDVGRRPLFACMGHQVQTQFTASGKDACKFLWRMPQLAAIEAHAHDLVEQGLRLLQRFKGRGLAEVAQEAQDQCGTDAQLGARVLTGAVQAVDHRLDRHAACGVGLRVKENLCMRYVIHSSSRKVGAGHIVKILLMQQNAGPGVVDVQKALQVGKGIGLPQGLYAGIGQRNIVALRQGKDQLGFERAFNVDMQFGLGHGPQQLLQTLRGDRGHFKHQQTPKVMPRDKGCGARHMMPCPAQYANGAPAPASHCQPKKGRPKAARVRRSASEALTFCRHRGSCLPRP